MRLRISRGKVEGIATLQCVYAHTIAVSQMSTVRTRVSDTNVAKNKTKNWFLFLAC